MEATGRWNPQSIVAWGLGTLAEAQSAMGSNPTPPLTHWLPYTSLLDPSFHAVNPIQTTQWPGSQGLSQRELNLKPGSTTS